MCSTPESNTSCKNNEGDERRRREKNKKKSTILKRQEIPKYGIVSVQSGGWICQATAANHDGMDETRGITTTRSV